MATYQQVIFFSLVGGLFSLIGGIIMLSNRKFASILATYGLPFAAGALLAAVFLDLLTDGLEESSASTVMTASLIGIFIFFFAERFLRWFHHHHSHEKKDPSISLIVVGDIMHNALDGVAIAAAFLVSVPTGVVTTLAVAAHEIPQEIGDFGLLLHKGMRRRNVLLINVLSALATTFAAVITFALGSNSNIPIGVLLGLSAGFLLYIALSDIIPTIHEKISDKRLFELQPFLMILGAALVAITISLAHCYIVPEHGHEDNSRSPESSVDIHNDE